MKTAAPDTLVRIGPRLCHAGTMNFNLRRSASRNAVAATLMIGVLSACSSGGAIGDTHILTKSEADARYLELVSPYNQALGQFETAVRSDHPYIPDIHSATVALVAALNDSKIILSTTRWPLIVTHDVSFMISADTRSIAGLKALETAATTSDLRAWGETWGQRTIDAISDGGAAAVEIRAKLGLPPPHDPSSPMTTA
jgi:hypothetical protein